MNRAVAFTGKDVRRLRGELAMTYERLAEHLGVDPVTVRRWEKQDCVKPVIVYAMRGLAYARKAVN